MTMEEWKGVILFLVCVMAIAMGVFIGVYFSAVAGLPITVKGN